MIKLTCDNLYQQYNSYLKEQIDKTEKKAKLLTIRVGEDVGSISYEKSLKKHCENLGVLIDCKVFEENTDQEIIEKVIEESNEDDAISSILIFQPLMGDYDKTALLEKIKPDKDVDGATFTNKTKLLDLVDQKNIAVTASAIHLFIKSEIPDITGKNVLIINRSHIIGIPLFFLLEKDNATVTVAHSRSQDIEGLMKDKDVIVTAVGKSKIFAPKELKDGAIVVDMGISQDEEGKFTGDMDMDALTDLNVSYLPSIGGIGKITRTIIIENTLINCLGDQYGR